MGEIRTGTCSWTDPTLLKSGWYPKEANTPEARLKFYATHFNTVEVDSSFYAIPAEAVVGKQVERTPDDFILHYKAFGLLTRHTVDVKRLPLTIRKILDDRGMAGSQRLTFDQAPSEVLDLSFEMFEKALLPAGSAGKLGCVLFQYPPYFTFREENMAYILKCKEKMPQYSLAIEFRHPSWVDGQNIYRTLDFLRENGLTFVSVDEPQFPSRSTMPPLAEATSKLAYVRFHGRNKETWFKKGTTTAERFSWLYSDEELEEWVPKARKLASQTEKTFLMFNNCFMSYAVVNAMRMGDLMLE